MTDDARAEMLLKGLARLDDSRADLQGFLHAVIRLAADLSGADAASIMLLDKDDSALVVAACHGVDETDIRRVSFEPGEGIAGRVLETGVGERFDDVVGDPQFIEFPWQQGRVHAMLVAPIRTAERVVGVLSVHAEQAGLFDDETQVWVEMLARQTAADVENAWLRETTRIDPLTRVFNRDGGTERLAIEFRRCRRHAWPLAVMAIDIDQFSAVNELHGRFVGDMVLREFARRVADEVRTEDVLARWAGELFVLGLSHTPTAAAEKIAERIRLGIQQRAFRSRRGAIPLTVSIGVANLDEHMVRTSELVERALEALRYAKRPGGNRIGMAEAGSTRTRLTGRWSGDPDTETFETR